MEYFLSLKIGYNADVYMMLSFDYSLGPRQIIALLPAHYYTWRKLSVARPYAKESSIPIVIKGAFSLEQRIKSRVCISREKGG